MENKVIELKPNNAQLYDIWLDNALKDEKVWPYLSMSPMRNYKIDLGSDSKEVHYIGKLGLGYFSAYFDRYMNSANCRLYVIDFQGEKLKKTESFNIIRELFKKGHFFKKFGIKHVDFRVHESNVSTLQFYFKRITHWGIQKEGAYNAMTGEWEDSYHFRLNEEDMKKYASYLYK